MMFFLEWLGKTRTRTASREWDRSFHPPLQGEGRAPKVRGVGCAATQGFAALRALSPQPAALRAATFPLQGKVTRDETTGE